MANASVRLLPLEGNLVAPGKSGDTFAALADLKGAPVGTNFKGTDGAFYRLVKMINASAPADGDLCVLDKDATIIGQDVNDGAAGDVGTSGVGVYVSAPAQNTWCFVCYRGPITTKVNGATDNLAVGSELILGAANDLMVKIIETPTATSAGRESVGFSKVVSTVDEAGLVGAYLNGVGW